MKIAYINSPSKGVDYHRLTKPLSTFKDVTAYNTIPLDKVNEVDCDVLIFSRCMYEPDQQEIIKAFRKKGVKIIVDVDDHWMLPSYHVGYKDYIKHNITNRITEAMALADEVWATHEKLAAKVRKYNLRVTIYPNAIDHLEQQWIPNPTASDKLRIGYVAGVTHERDLDLTTDAFRVAHDTMNIQAVICGYNQRAKEIFERYYYFMSGRYEIGTDTRIIQELNQYNYGTFYDEMDVAIAPLEENTFNTMKSNLKIIEAGMKATPIIVSHTHPYVDDHPAIFKTNNWRKAFEKANRMGKDKLAELGLSLRDYVIENYSLDKHKRKL
jgi:predicted O-linked N-acetylglucosamine transferase (SPINDLY family)